MSSSNILLATISSSSAETSPSLLVDTLNLGLRATSEQSLNLNSTACVLRYSLTIPTLLFALVLLLYGLLGVVASFLNGGEQYYRLLTVSVAINCCLLIILLLFYTSILSAPP